MNSKPAAEQRKTSNESFITNNWRGNTSQGTHTAVTVHTEFLGKKNNSS